MWDTPVSKSLQTRAEKKGRRTITFLPASEQKTVERTPQPEARRQPTIDVELWPAFLFEWTDDDLVEDQFGGRSRHPDDQGRDLCWG